MNTIHQELQTRPTYVEIDLDTLRSNMRSIQSLSTSKIMWVVKANAYGHGAIEVAHCLQDAGADYLGVALPEEGAELREAGITIPILVLSAIADEQIHLCIKNDLTLTAPSDERVQRINEVADEMKTRARIHINVDTGMGRIGVHYSRVEKFFPAITKASSVDVEGIYSHFSSSEKNGKQTQIQLKRFLSVCRQFEEAGITFEIKHIANSAATVLNLDTHFDMVRVGLALYGFAEGYILPRGLPLKPVLSWKTQVSYFKSLSKGEGVGYGHSYIAS